MPVKNCVGAVIYDSLGNVFLMSSPKWNRWVIPGGGIEDGEDLEEALHREIREEMNIEITDLHYAGESWKEPSADFHDPTMRFHFHNFYARACSTDVRPNVEISEFDWYTREDSLGKDLLDSTRNVLEGYWAWKEKQTGHRS